MRRRAAHNGTKAYLGLRELSPEGRFGYKSEMPTITPRFDFLAMPEINSDNKDTNLDMRAMDWHLRKLMTSYVHVWERGRHWNLTSLSQLYLEFYLLGNAADQWRANHRPWLFSCFLPRRTSGLTRDFVVPEFITRIAVRFLAFKHVPKKGTCSF